MKKRGLGRGLDVLLNKTTVPSALIAGKSGSDKDDKGKSKGVKHLPIESLVAGLYQPRKVFDVDALEALADSIRSQGVIQPLVVREVERDGAKRYEILAGERRWRASQIAGVDAVPVIIQQISDQEALAVALVENIQREDLSPMEEAEAIFRFIEEFELTHQEVGEILGRSRSTISNTLRLLELAPQVQKWLLQKKLDMGHARAILSLSKAEQVKIAELIIENKLTVREVENLINQQKKSPVGIKSHYKDPNVNRLEISLSEHFGAKVGVQSNAKGKGKMTIHYDSLDQLDGILEKLGLE